MATKFNTVVTSTATNSQITSEGNNALITRGYAEEFYSGGGGGGATSVAYFLQAIGSGTQNLLQGIANSITVDYDTSQLSSSASHFTVGGTGEITVTNAGNYFIAYSVDSLHVLGNTRTITTAFIEVDSSGSFTELTGSRGRGYSRNTTSAESTIYGSSIVSLSAGDKVRVRASQDLATSSHQAQVQGNLSHIQITSLTASEGLSSETDTSSSGALAIDLTNIGGTYYTSQRSSGALSIASGAVAGGFAHLRLTYSTEPSVTGATKMAGATYDTSGGAEMKMVVYNDGSASYYYFLEI